MLALVPLARRVAPWLQLPGFLLLIAIVYWPSMAGDYVWDDHDGLMLGNPQMEQPWGWLENWYAPQTLNYEPLTFDSYWIQCRLFGENRVVFHLSNVVLHALNAWLLTRVLRRLSLPGAGLAGLLFALHPVCVESTAWIYERNNLLSVCFMLLSAQAFLRPERQWRWYATALAMFACSLLSKSLTVMFPLALMGYCLSQQTRWDWRTLAPVAPFTVLSLAIGWLRWQSEAVAMQAETTPALGSFLERCLNAGHALSFYLGKLLWPWELWTVYPQWSNDPSSPQAYLPCLPIVLAIAVACLLWRTSWQPISWGLAFFALNLLPLVGFIDNAYFQYTFVADRWQYLAMIGGLSAIAFAVTRAVEFLPSAQRAVGQVAVCCSLLAPLAALSWQHAHVYQGMETWCRFTLEKNPQAYFAHVNLANAVLARGAHQEAVQHLREAFGIRPADAKIALSLGAALLEGQEIEEAANVYRTAANACPQSVQLHYNLGLAELSLGHRAAAARAFAKAIEIDGKFAPAHDKLGALSVMVGKAAVGVKHLSIAVALEPQNAGYHFNLGTAYAGIEDFEASIASFQSALELEPLHRDARLYLAKVQMHVNRYEDASATLARLLVDHPGDSEAELLLGKVQHRLTRASAFPIRR